MPAPLPSDLASPQPSPLFARVRERIVDELRAAASAGLPALAEMLDEAADRAPDGRDRQSMFAAATRLRRESAQRIEGIGRALEQRAQRCLEVARSPNAGELALVDDDELEQQIAAGELAREARERSGAVYERYVTRLRRMLGSSYSWDDEERNPLGARTLAAALLTSVADAAEGAHARDRLRNLAWKRFADPLADAIDAAERLLAQAGISDERLAQIDAGGAAHAPEATRHAPEPMQHTSESMRHAPEPMRAVDLAARAERDAATLGSSPLAGDPAGPRLRTLPTLQPVNDLERDAIAFAHSIGAMPYTREARAEFFGNVRTRLHEAGATPGQIAVVDLVAAMFDYVIDDRRMPEAVRPLVWRLQQPTVALSLLDTGYLGDDPRSLRRLIEHFGAISAAFADEITRGSELHRRLETVVRAVEIVTSALQARSTVMAQQVQKEHARAARSVGQLIEHVVRERRSLEETPGRRNRRDFVRRPSREREEEVTGHLHALLAERLQRHSPPDSVRDFVMNVWLRHLRTAALRDGEQSAEFQVSLRVVDDLLWSLEGGNGHSRRELVQRIPPLIRLMTQGVREIGARDDEFKSFFDELFLIHLRRMQRRERERGATRTGDAAGTTIVRDDAAAEKAPAALASEAVISRPVAATAPVSPPTISRPAREPEAGASGRHLLEVLESLDLADLPSAPRRLTLEPARAVEWLARGDWVELVAHDGSSGYAKVAWINRRRTVVLLVRRADRRAMSLRIDELRERFARGRAYLVER